VSAPDPDRGAIAFAERLLGVLAEGRYTATYKYAVLLGLVDLCLEHSTRTGAAPSSVTTRQLAEKVVALYWTHAVLYAPARGGGAVLRQNAGSQAAIVSAIRRFREKHAPDPSAPLARARAHDAKAYARLLRRVEWILAKMPLPRVQRVGERNEPFLYQIGWDEHGIRRSHLRDPDFDNLVRFVGAAGEHLVRLAGLLRPLIQREWAARVARLNGDLVPERGLEDFLFKADRVALGPVRAPLRELADGRCFYCAGRVQGTPEVDHFIPWSRYPDNGLENLVVAHTRCNGDKSDHLADSDHVERWVARARTHAADLERIAAHVRWDRHPERSLGVARAIYLRLPPEAMLWRERGAFARADRPRLLAALGQA